MLTTNTGVDPSTLNALLAPIHATGLLVYLTGFIIMGFFIASILRKPVRVKRFKKRALYFTVAWAFFGDWPWALFTAFNGMHIFGIGGNAQYDIYVQNGRVFMGWIYVPHGQTKMVETLVGFGIQALVCGAICMFLVWLGCLIGSKIQKRQPDP